MKTTAELVACAKREVRLRENVFPGWVQRGKLTADKAAHELDCMRGIVAKLERILELEELSASWQPSGADPVDRQEAPPAASAASSRPPEEAPAPTPTPRQAELL